MTFQVKIHQIRVFAEVIYQGNTRGTSQMLNMSQPTLSKSIQKLEEGLAAQLLFRRNKGVALTGAGKSSYQCANSILEGLRAAQEEIRQRQGQLAGQVNIGIGASISHGLTPAVIPRFHRQHPQVKACIVERQLVLMINELRQRGSDFTISAYYQGSYDHEFTFRRLLEKRFTIFYHPGHPATSACSIKQLLDYSQTMSTPHGSHCRQLNELLDDQAQTPQAGVVCEASSAYISLVTKNDFLSILPEKMGYDLLHGQGLVMLPVSEILPRAAYYLIQRRDSCQTPLTASLIMQLRQKCGYLQS